MFAVIKTGGKQYTVSPNMMLAVEKLASEPGSRVTLSDVLMASRNGERALAPSDTQKVQVQAEVIKHFKDDKKIIFKKKRRHNYRRKKGHRQILTLLKIQDILWSA